MLYFNRSRFIRRDAVDGCMRGIDFYRPREFFGVLTDAFIKYKNVHGIYPNLIQPNGFNEKIFYKKFFGEFKIPESGNKLLTTSFIPFSIANDITVPEVVWRSKSHFLPENENVEPGYYYLKASHGSDMFKKIEYPINKDKRKLLEIESESWLKNNFGFWSGEWWYCVFEKEIFLEKSISKNSNSVAIGFYVFDKKIKFISLNKKTEDITEITWLNDDFEPLSYQSQSYSRVSNFDVNFDVEKLKSMVVEISGEHDFVRVDILLGDDGVFYLGEMTFSPGNALSVRPQELEKYLGDSWILDLKKESI